MIQASATVFAAIFIAFFFVWELALVVCIFIPLIIAVGKIQAAVTIGYAQEEKSSIAEGGKVGTFTGLISK